MWRLRKFPGDLLVNASELLVQKKKQQRNLKKLSFISQFSRYIFFTHSLTTLTLQSQRLVKVQRKNDQPICINFSLEERYRGRVSVDIYVGSYCTQRPLINLKLNSRP